MSGAPLSRLAILFVLASSLVAAPALADWATPGLGFNYTMDQLVAMVQVGKMAPSNALMVACGLHPVS